MNFYMELLIILLLVLLNGIFSMSEIALVSARKSRLEAAAKKGNARAKAALDLTNAPNKFLSTVQIGITLIGILTGIYSGENITNDLDSFLRSKGVDEDYAHSLAVGIIVVCITYLSLVLGELVPKRIGLANPEGIAKMVAGPMRIVSFIAAPFVWLLALSTNAIIKMLRVKPSMGSKVTEEEIRAIIHEGTEGGEVQEIEQDIVERVFLLGDRKVDSLMTHRNEVVLLSLHSDPAKVKETVMGELHSVYPVYKANKDHVEGMVHLKDLFIGLQGGGDFVLREIMKPAQFISENTSAYKALEIFKESGTHQGIVIDEYGLMQGLITINDILESLVGNVSEFYKEDFSITKRDDGSYLIDGHHPFHDFLDYFDLMELAEGYDVNTIGGLIQHVGEKIPKPGDKLRWKNFEFEVVDMDGARLDKILVKLL